ncbi:Uncharacterised protein [Streptococcus pneumoniae]|nr:Uncharacterised protein [Streptococcus pneumoniae]
MGKQLNSSWWITVSKPNKRLKWIMLTSNVSLSKMVISMKMNWLSVHQLLLSWDTLTTVKQPFWILFVTHVLRQVKQVVLLSISVPTKSWKMVRRLPSLIHQDTRPLHQCVRVVLLLPILRSWS